MHQNKVQLAREGPGLSARESGPHEQYAVHPRLTHFVAGRVVIVVGLKIDDLFAQRLFGLRQCLRNHLFHPGQSRIEAFRVFSAALSESGLSAAMATHTLRKGSDQLFGIQSAVEKIIAHAHH
tara:strand:- start:215 stop:583 length:369 start_codon:yes stop_codon:yes gene_type:complete